MYNTLLSHKPFSRRFGVKLHRLAGPMVMSVLWSVWLLLSACSGSDINEPTPPILPPSPDTPMQAGFYITVGDVATPASTVGRATPTDGTYDPGQGYENFIDIPGRDFRFLFFTGDTDGSKATYITDLQVNSVIQISGTPTSKTYHVLGSVPQSVLSATSFRVMVLANWGSYPEPESGATTIDQLCKDTNAKFNFEQNSTVITAEKPIPLYGINRYEDVKYDDAYFYNLGTIHLLRAYAKVDVQINDPRWSILSAEITSYYSIGYKAPKNVYTNSDYVHGAYDKDYTYAPNVPSMVPSTDLKFTRIAADSSLYRIYIPEFNNLAANGTALSDTQRTRIRLRFTDRNTGWESYLGEQYVEFKYYQAPEGHPELKDKHFNVMRNYWYKFTVTKGAELADLEVQLDVQPYASVELDPGFGLERDPIDGYIVLKKNAAGEPTLFYDDDFDQYYDFQKYLLKSNYSNQIGRVKEPPFEMTGDIWLIKRANGKTDEIGSDDAPMSLFYDATSGIYYDSKGCTLNLVYSSDDSETIDKVAEVKRDFLYNNIVLSDDENAEPSSYYDFTDGTYKGALDPTQTDENTQKFYRNEIQRLDGGWVQIIPYWAKWDYSNGAHLYFNIYSDKYYDINGYCLQGAFATHFEYYVSDGYKEITLAVDDQERPTLVYDRESGNYFRYTDGANRTQVTDPVTELGLQKDTRLKNDPWPPAPIDVTP